jgi:hypothetical protein
MNTRVKFYVFSSFTKRDLQNIDAYFAAKAFTNGKSQGFLKDEFTSTSWTGRFVRRNQYSEELTDPFGKKYSQERVIFDEIPFRISLDWPHVEIYGQFQLGGLLLNKIAEATKFDRSLVPLEFNFQELFKRIKAEYKSAKVTSLLIGEIVLGSNSFGKFQAEGNEDVRKYIKNILENKKYKILSFKLSWKENDKEISAKFDINGKIEIKGGPSKTVLPSLRMMTRKTILSST